MGSLIKKVVCVECNLKLAGIFVISPSCLIIDFVWTHLGQGFFWTSVYQKPSKHWCNFEGTSSDGLKPSSKCEISPKRKKLNLGTDVNIQRILLLDFFNEYFTTSHNIK